MQGAGTEASWLKGRVTYGSDCVVRDLKLGDALYAVRNRAGASNTLFERVRFRGGGGTGVDSSLIKLGDGASSCDHITFSDCLVERNLGVEDASYSRGYLDISIVENGDPGGAHVDSITFAGCHVGVSNGRTDIARNIGSPYADLVAYTWHGGDLVADHGWSNLRIVDCVFEAADAFCIDLADYPLPSGERASGPALVSGCTLKGGGARGSLYGYTICVESPKGVVIEGNTIYRGANNTFKMGCGDMSTVSPATVVRDNLFDLASDQGVALGAPYFYLKGAGNRFTGNAVRAAAGDLVFWLHQARNNTITGNTLTVPASATIFGFGEGCSGNVLAPNTVN